MRCVSLHARLNVVIKGSNVDSSEDIKILVTISKCLSEKAKQSDLAADDLKKSLEDKLLKELTVRYVDSIPVQPKNDYINDIAIYDLFGYLLKAWPSVTECEDCCKAVRCDELQLPPDFTADNFTALRTRGGLIFVAIGMFKAFRVIETIIQSHFNPIGQIYTVPNT